MPKIVQCPNCQRRLRVPDDLLRKQVKCPACATLLTVRDDEDSPTSAVQEDELPSSTRSEAPAPREVPDERQRSRRSRPSSEDEYEPDKEEQYEDEEDDFEDERPRRRRVANRASWRKVRTGVTLELVSICVLVLAVLIALIGGMILAGAGGAPRGGGVEALSGIVGLIFLASAILAIIGYIFCMQAPPKHGAKGLAIAALVLAAASLLVVIVSGIVDLARGPSEVRLLVGKDAQQGFRPLEALGAALHAAKVLVFLFFMRAVAKSLRARSLEKSIRLVIILAGLTVGAWVALMVVALLGAGAGGGLLLANACVCLLILLGFVTLIFYLVTLGQIRTRISRYLLTT